ncbi:MAG: copper chaperone [Gemmatimonadetes bacterium]|jgi:copper chaperone|nr:copper chaperone [Gemmatimonadota bacterium]
MERVTLNIDGMTCGHCVKTVGKAIRELAGVTIEEVKVGQATVAFDPATATSDQIAQAIEGQGYDVKDVRAA